MKVYFHIIPHLRVWFSGNTTAFQAVVGGSIPLTRTYERAPLGAFSYVRVK